MARKKRFGSLDLYPSELIKGIRKWYIDGEECWYMVGANRWYITAEDYWYNVVRGVTPSDKA
jgi:hypothetical protein